MLMLLETTEYRLKQQLLLLLLLLLLPFKFLCQDHQPTLGSRVTQPEPARHQPLLPVANKPQHGLNSDQNSWERPAQQHQQQKSQQVERTLPDEVVLAGENNNFALLDPPDTEFHVWRAPFPSLGEAWPQPKGQSRVAAHPAHLSIALPEFNFILASPSKSDLPPAVVDLIEQAFQRYRQIIVDQRAVSVAVGLLSMSAIGQIAGLKIRLKMKSLAADGADKWRSPLLPTLDMDESYSLQISKSDALLTAKEPWGVLRGLETFSQLVWQTDDGSLYINRTNIFDKPRFKHRGLHVDTSRHYITMDTLKKNLDAMEMNKLNVFHWHIVDDQSFPYQSVVLPKLSEKGAYDSSSVYSLSDIRVIIEYARLRGIRVIPEFDTPGHTHSWSLGYPEIFTKCYNYARRWTGFYGPMNPALNATYEFLKTLYTEITGVFADNYIHLGADEVGTSCWEGNPQVNQMRADFGFSRSDQLIDYYFRRLQNIVTSLSAGKPAKKRGFIVWQEAYDHGVMLKSGTIVQVWKGEATDVAMVAQAGYRVLYSTCWYLDRLEYGPQWTKLYLCDPVANYASSFNGGPFQQQQQPQQQRAPQVDPATPSWMANVLGGEACMWNEYQDESTVLQRIWPLTCAVAERLWSAPESTRDLLAAGRRIEEQRCRMRARGIPVGVASGPGSCPQTLQQRCRSGPPRPRRQQQHEGAASAADDDAVGHRWKPKKKGRQPPVATKPSFLRSKIEPDDEDTAKEDVSLRRVLVQQQQLRPQHHLQIREVRHQHHSQHPLVLFFGLVLAALALFLVLSRAVFVLRITRYGSSSAGGPESAAGGVGGPDAKMAGASLLWPWLRPRRLLLCLAFAAACNVLVWLWTTLL